MMRYDCSQPSWSASPLSHLLLAQLTGRKSFEAPSPWEDAPTSSPELVHWGAGGEPSQSPVLWRFNMDRVKVKNYLILSLLVLLFIYIVSYFYLF